MNHRKPLPQRPADQRRRRFFRDLLGEVVSTCQEIGGQPQLKTGDLTHLPDAVLRQMVPVLKPHQPIKIEGNQLLFYCRQTNTFEAVSRLRPEQKQFIMAMDGQSSLEQLSHKVAVACCMPPSAAYRAVKPFFCLLARFGACAPKDAHLEDFENRPDTGGEL